ncbi:hypothetical protein M422DRAFT_267212 [Sphaerobolus stellatus SS14]|uniref:Uncharacterized protein n=1 Tax=Sphaerobolus stellatus (strain SS14) TaxID=990650 RepID=A0A0C9UQ18_SPHS4|nr:hypothetical protein M422DRAFT_267212 [Sphaerobolus stellatus SS14]
MHDVSQVNKYWKAHDKERMQREARYKELLDAEVKAAERRKADEIARAKEKAKEEAAAREKEKEKGLEKEKEAGPPGVNKGKAREVPKTPRKVTPKKSQTEIWLESEEDEDEDKLQSCMQCIKRKIPCVSQSGKKRFMMEVETRATADLSAADARVLQLLELKSKGIEIPEDLKTRIRAERGVIQRTLNEQLEDLTVRMDSIQKHTAWSKNGLPRLTPEVPSAAAQGTKRKGDNEGDCAEGSKKKKKKKVVETEDEESTMR